MVSVLLAACSKHVEPVVVHSEGKPALWRVQGKTGTAWLFGTIHLLPPDIDWQTLAFHDAVRKSDALILEASGLDDQKMIAEIFANMGVSGGQPTLASRIDPVLHPLLDRLDEVIPGPRSVLDHMESWAAALTLASAQSADLGVSQGSGVEHILTMRFRAENKPISGLETISQQFGYFDTLPEKDQRLMLDSVLRNNATHQQQYQTMFAAWIRGVPDAVIADHRDGILASPVIRKALLDGRNRVWATQIAKVIDKGDTVFVAVGAAHMAGKGGVPALLASSGYVVERVQ